MRETLRQIGRSIKRSAEYLPIRNHAAAVATTAPPKNYLAQLNAVYDDFIKRWRYVKDPAHKELVTASPQAVAQYLLALDGIGVGMGRGAGDCDCASVAIGGELLSIGFPVRLATTSGPRARPGNLFEHVFVQAQVPKLGWVTVDPVLHPTRPFGATASHSRIAYWTLEGRLLGYSGNVSGSLSGILSIDSLTTGEEPMYLGADEVIMGWKDYSGALGLADAGSYGEPEEWERVGLANWGYLAGSYGVMSADDLPGGGPLVEVSGTIGGLARTPMIELAPEDYNYVGVVGAPYDGMLGLGDDGTVYRYDGLGGFFKKLFRKAKKFVKKVGKRIVKGIKKVVRKLPGGKMLLKIAGKIHKVAMKLVKPLAKFVGKYAAKLAPIAALIPGYGPAIAAGLYTAGKVANLMNKYGVSLIGGKGKARTLTSKKGPKAIRAMQKELAAQAQQLKATKRGKRVARRMMASPGRRMAPGRRGIAPGYRR